MKTRVETLLEKYWETETSLDEERELKTLLRATDGYLEEKALFGLLDDFKLEIPKKIDLPKEKQRPTFHLGRLGWAASIAFLACFIWVWQSYEQLSQEQLAYQQVMEALAQIQTNLSKGQQQLLLPLNDLKYLNTTNQLFKPTSKK